MARPALPLRAASNERSGGPGSATLILACMKEARVIDARVIDARVSLARIRLN